MNDDNRPWRIKLVPDDDLDLAGYLIRARPSSLYKSGDSILSLDVEVYEYWNVDDDTGTTMHFKPRECEPDINKAEIYIRGFIKWDGCFDLDFRERGLHFCGKKHACRLGALMEGIYQLAVEMMPENADLLV
jgi:hypothetical protein